MNNKTFYHLSHIDLDGYSCQLIMKYTPYTIKNYNANYGAEVKQKLEMILEAIKQSDTASYIMITDLNLTVDESKWLDNKVKKLNEEKRCDCATS